MIDKLILNFIEIVYLMFKELVPKIRFFKSLNPKISKILLSTAVLFKMSCLKNFQKFKKLFFLPDVFL